MKRKAARPRSPLALVLAAALSAGTACGIGAPRRVHAPADSAAGEMHFAMASPGQTAIIVPVYIDGHGPYDFILDTGSTLTCMDTSLAGELRLPERHGYVGLGVGIGGSGRVRLVQVDSMRVGNAHAYGLTACAVDLQQLARAGSSARGLLGLNFLKAFRVAIDFDRQVLRLTSAGGAPHGPLAPARTR